MNVLSFQTPSAPLPSRLATVTPPPPSQDLTTRDEVCDEACLSESALAAPPPETNPTVPLRARLGRALSRGSEAVAVLTGLAAVGAGVVVGCSFLVNALQMPPGSDLIGAVLQLPSALGLGLAACQLALFRDIPVRALRNLRQPAESLRQGVDAPTAVREKATEVAGALATNIIAQGALGTGIAVAAAVGGLGGAAAGLAAFVVTSVCANSAFEVATRSPVSGR